MTEIEKIVESEREVSKTVEEITELAKSLGLEMEPHGLTPMAPLHTLRWAEPSEAYPPSLKLRRIPSFIPAFIQPS